MRLALVGQGNEHSTWRCWSDALSRVASLSIHGTYVLVLRHPRAPGVSEPLPALVSALGMEVVSRPLARFCVKEAAVLALRDCAASGTAPSATTLAAIDDALSHPLDDARSDMDGSPSLCNAWIEMDHTWLDGPHGDAGLCIELKPKAGLLPAGKPLSEAAPNVCRFCLYADLKAQRAAVAAAKEAGTSVGVAHYCPLDLYSADEGRVQRACEKLVQTPRNNVRVFKAADASLVYGGKAGAGGEQRRALDALVGAAAGEVSGGAFIERVLSRVIMREQPLLQRLLAAQARATIGSERAAALYEHASANLLGGDGTQLDGLIRTWQARCRCHTHAARSDVVRCDALDGERAHDEQLLCVPCPEGCSRPPKDHTLPECVATLAEWLLGLAASDVSLMIALARAEDGTAREAPGVICFDHAATSAPAGSPSVSPASAKPPPAASADGVWRYRVAVVDTRAKPPAKIREHARLDREIVEHWTRTAAGAAGSAAAPGRPHTCGPPPQLKPSVMEPCRNCHLDPLKKANWHSRADELNKKLDAMIAAARERAAREGAETRGNV